MKISYSAPAKVILSGEHAVVYGKPALVSTIDLRLKFSIWKEAAKTTDRDILFISQKVKNYLTKEKKGFINIPFNFKIESDIPIGRGLGSSAALSVASSAAFLEFYTGQVFDKVIVNNLAYEIEKKFHKNPSGVDNSTVCKGGLIMYKKNISLEKLNYRITKNIEKNLLLIDSGKPEETTGEMVKLVKSVGSVKSVKIILNQIEIETKKILGAIEKENVDQFRNSVVANEKLLEDLGVVSDETIKLLNDLSKFGVGKVTGAGGKKTGSGFILFYAEDRQKLIKYLNIKKIIFYKFIPDNIGLTRP